MDDKIKIGAKYTIQIKAGNQNLTYTGFIIGYDDKFLFIKDKFSKNLIIPIFNLISLLEEEDD